MWQKEQIIAELQKRGKRITEQRKVLLDVILEGNWTCCKEIYYEAVKRDPSIGMATVYRMLSTLEEIGVLTRTYRYSFPPEEKGSQDGNSGYMYNSGDCGGSGCEELHEKASVRLLWGFIGAGSEKGEGEG